MKNWFQFLITALFLITLYENATGTLTAGSSMRSIFILLFIMSMYTISRHRELDGK